MFVQSKASMVFKNEKAIRWTVKHNFFALLFEHFNHHEFASAFGIAFQICVPKSWRAKLRNLFCKKKKEKKEKIYQNARVVFKKWTFLRENVFHFTGSTCLKKIFFTKYEICLLKKYIFLLKTKFLLLLKN